MDKLISKNQDGTFTAYGSNEQVNKKLFSYEDTDLTPYEVLKLKMKYKKLLEATQWINVKDHLPKTEQNGFAHVIVLLDDGFVGATDFIDGDFQLWADSGKVTHWMPSPKPIYD